MQIGGEELKYIEPTKINCKDDKNQFIVTISGEVDLSNCVQLENAIESRGYVTDYHYIVDMKEVTYIDSETIKILLCCNKRILDVNSRMVIIASERVKRVLFLAGINKIIPIQDESYFSGNIAQFN